MFFSRLRRHAKWMFVFLALVFAVGFVGFGIGANQNASLGDLFRGDGGTTSGNLSVGDAREQLRENPKSAEAKRDLATALQEDGQTDEAITVLSGYVEQSPKDEDALRELAGLYLARANALAQEAQIAQLRASYRTFGSTFSVPLDLGNGATLGPDPIDEAISTLASQEVSAAYGEGADRVSRTRSRPTTSWRPSLLAIRTSSWSSPRRRSRAGTSPRRSPPTSASSSSRRTTPARRSSSSRSSS